MRIQLPSTDRQMPPRIAVIGSGIAGLAAAWHLRDAAVTLFEADAHLGGHAHTVDITLDGQRFGVDTGFLVCNHKTYPGLIGLFEALGVELAPSEMGFSVQVKQADGHSMREWSGTGFAGLFAQPGNAMSPRFWGMLRDILHFNHVATRLAEQQADSSLAESTGAFLKRLGLGEAFRDDYLIPMVSCIWSCSPRQMMEFPISTLIRFCHNHGLLQVANQPQWHTVKGGSREYVQRLAACLPDVRLQSPVLGIRRHLDGIAITTALRVEQFDALVLACHSDQSLRLLGQDATPTERELLGAIRYQSNRAVLHTDTALLPERRQAWAAWNYESCLGADASPTVCLHYWLNQLQPLPTAEPVIVSLNPLREPASSTVLASFDYAHPIFDQAAISAQAKLPLLTRESALRQTWFAGAWMGYGFHEDGYQAGLRAAMGVREAWGLPAMGASRSRPEAAHA